MPILALWSTSEERSLSLPSTRSASAALARPGPMAAAISAPLTGFSNDRTDPSGKEMLIMVTTSLEDSEQGSSADMKCRRHEAGKRHEGAHPAGSRSDGGGDGWSGGQPAFHAGGDSGRPRASQVGPVRASSAQQPLVEIQQMAIGLHEAVAAADMLLRPPRQLGAS